VSELLSEHENVREVMVLTGSKIITRLVFESEGKLDVFLHWLEELEQIDEYNLERAVRTVKKEPDAIVAEGVRIVIPCYECKKPIIESPVTTKIDDRTHYLCCGSCLKLYKERYARIKKGATAYKGAH
ncbi:MAG: hypothetical protein V3U09_02325, partial [Thermoplasmata archaeon]